MEPTRNSRKNTDIADLTQPIKTDNTTDVAISSESCIEISKQTSTKNPISDSSNEIEIHENILITLGSNSSLETSSEDNSTIIEKKTIDDYLNEIVQYGNEMKNNNSKKARNYRAIASKDKSEIIEPIVVKSEISDSIYESESEPEHETDQTVAVKTINDMVGDIVKNLNRNEYGNCKEYTFEEHNEIIRSFEEYCNFDDNLDLTSAIKAASNKGHCIANSNGNRDIFRYRKLYKQYHFETLRSAIDKYYKAHNLEKIDLEYIEKQHDYILPSKELIKIEALMKLFARLDNITEKQGSIGAKNVRLILYAAYYDREQTHEDFLGSENIMKSLRADYYGDISSHTAISPQYYIERLETDEQMEKQLTRRMSEYYNDNNNKTE